MVMLLAMLFKTFKCDIFQPIYKSLNFVIRKGYNFATIDNLLMELVVSIGN